MPSHTPNDIRFARLAALADADTDAPLDVAARESAAADTGGQEALDQRIAEQQHLREACSRVMDSAAHRCPDLLRAQLTQAHTPPPAVIGRIVPSRWIGAVAAAALIAVSTVAVVGALKTLRTGPHIPSMSIVQAINTNQAAQFARRHDVCGSNPSELFQNELFPKTLEGLNNGITDVIGGNLGSVQLDLSALGYRYRGTGHCPVPGPGAVHVVYSNDQGKALSLWLRPDDGLLDLADGQVYGPPADGPQGGRIMVWRQGDMVLYLVGDLPEDVEQARPQFTLHPA